MTLEFRLPDLGENIETGDVVSLLVKEGDEISPNQPVLEVETGKATVELPCPYGGKVEKIHVRPGQTVPVGALLLTLAESAAAGQARVPGTEAVADHAGKQAPPSVAASTAASTATPATQAGLWSPETDVPEPSAANLPGSRSPAAEVRGAVRPTASAAQPATHLPTQPHAQVPAQPAGQMPAQPAAHMPAQPVGHMPTQPVGHMPTQPVGQMPTQPAAGAAREAGGGGPAWAARVVTGLETAPAGPATRRLARELGIDLRMVRGTGPGGRITEEDVKQAVREAAASAVGPAPAEPPTGHDAWGPIRALPLPAIRRTIAQNMIRSVTSIPQVTNFDDADVTELERIRKGSMADYVQGEVKLTLLPFVIKAVAHALRLHPAMNASLDMETGQVVYKQYINIGVAVDTERGLVVPVLRHVDRLSIPQIASALVELASKARANKLVPDELRGGTFTISNLGAVGGSYSTPIINPPEVGILLTGRAREAPVVVEGQVAIRLMLPLSLTYDHRLIDGAAAARFLNEVKSYLQIPGRLLLAP